MDEFQNSWQYAEQLDMNDPLISYRDRFHMPQINQQDAYYLCGNSLGLQPKTCNRYVNEALDDWAKLGVAGHTEAKHPWLPYHELVTQDLAALVGAKPEEVVAMNSLTVNLHLLFVSFYQPTKTRYKILIEQDAFPSDQYLVKSQLRFHGLDPADALIELKPKEGADCIATEDILACIEEQGDSIAVIMLGGVNYLTGQAFALQKITQAGQAKGCYVGFDLAHAAGNLVLNLHDWGVDFAAWCSYKYINAGPGAIAGCFIHKQHINNQTLPRFEGWWGNDKQKRFLMEPAFDAIPTVEAWQLSNPPILQLAALRASLEIFTEIGMPALREKSELLTAYLYYLLQQLPSNNVHILTPAESEQRGCQLSIHCPTLSKNPLDALKQQGVICDYREPGVIRIAPTPLYNHFTDVYQFVQALSSVL